MLHPTRGGKIKHDRVQSGQVIRIVSYRPGCTMHTGSNISIAMNACLPPYLTVHKTWCSVSPNMQACC